MDKRISAALGAAFSLTLVWLAFRNADPGRIMEIFCGMNLWALFPALFTVPAELLLRGIKWKLLLAPAARAGFGQTLRLATASLALNNILPLRLGDLARGFIGAGLFKSNALTVFSTILAEKVLDAAALLLMAALAAGTARLFSGLQLGAFSGVLAVSGALLLSLYLCRADKRLSSFFEKFPGVKKGFEELTLGFKAFKSFPSACLIFSLALAQWFMNAMGYYFAAGAFGLGGQVTVPKSVILSFAGASASSVPAAPGAFGNFEFAVAAVLSSWGPGKEPALAYSLGVHLLFYSVITVSGIVFLHKLGYTPSAVSRLFGKKDI